MYKHILLPVDGSELSEYAANEGVRLAHTLGSEITFIYVVDISLVTIPDSESAISNIDLIERNFREQGRRALDAMKQNASAAGVEAEALLAEGVVADEIEKAATKVDADLIVIGTHGRRGLNRLLLGSVADAVARCAKCPVLLIRPV